MPAKGYALPELLPLFRRPDKDSYHVVRYKLIMRYLLGDDSAKEILDELPLIYHMYQNLDFYVALFGHKRAMRIFLSKLARVTPDEFDQVSMLLELYKESDEYLEPLVDALLELKVRVSTSAPENLMKIFDDVIAQAGTAKKNAWIRKVQVLLSYIKMLESAGPEPVARAVDVLLNRMTPAPAVAPPAPMKPPSDVDFIRVLKVIASANASGRALPIDDVRAMFETPEQAAAVLRRVLRKSDPMAVKDSKLGGLVLTPLAVRRLLQDGLITQAEKRRIYAFMRQSSTLQRLIQKGLLPSPEDEKKEGEEDVEEEAEE